MPKNLYVCFDDSQTDPTYINADEAWLVQSDADPDSGNPCALDASRVEVPVLPYTPEEVRKFADLLGWDLATDNDGQIVLYTGIVK